MNDHIEAPINPVPADQVAGQSRTASAQSMLARILAEPRAKRRRSRRYMGTLASAAAVIAVCGTFVTLLLVTRSTDRDRSVAPAQTATWGMTATVRVLPGPQSELSLEEASERAAAVLTARFAANGVEGFRVERVTAGAVVVFIPTAESPASIDELLWPADLRIYDIGATLRAQSTDLAALVARTPAIGSAKPSAYLLATTTRPPRYDWGPHRTRDRLLRYQKGLPAGRRIVAIPEPWTIFIPSGDLGGPTPLPGPGTVPFALLEGTPLISPDDIAGIRRLDETRLALTVREESAARLNSVSGPLVGVATFADFMEEAGRVTDPPLEGEIVLTVGDKRRADAYLRQFAGGGLDADLIIDEFTVRGRPGRTGTPISQPPELTTADAKPDSYLEVIRAQTALGEVRLITGVRSDGTEAVSTIINGRDAGTQAGCELTPTDPTIRLCGAMGGTGAEAQLVGRVDPRVASVSLVGSDGITTSGSAAHGWFYLVAPSSRRPTAIVALDTEGAELGRTELEPLEFLFDDARPTTTVTGP